MKGRPQMSPGDVNDAFLGSLGVGRRNREVFVWKRGVYKRLVSCYNLDRSVLDAFSDSLTDPEDNYRTVAFQYGELGKIVAVKTTVTLEQLLNKPLDNPAFDALSKINFTDPFRDGGGVVFSVKNHGDWIMHTLGHPQGTLGGKSYIVIYANSYEDQDINVESLDQFIRTRK